MNLYTFSICYRNIRGFLQVIAETQEQAESLLWNDGHRLDTVQCETVFSINGHTEESIHFSLEFEDN